MFRNMWNMFWVLEHDVPERDMPWNGTVFSLLFFFLVVGYSTHPILLYQGLRIVHLLEERI